MKQKLWSFIAIAVLLTISQHEHAQSLQYHIDEQHKTAQIIKSWYLYNDGVSSSVFWSLVRSCHLSAIGILSHYFWPIKSYTEQISITHHPYPHHFSKILIKFCDREHQANILREFKEQKSNSWIEPSISLEHIILEKHPCPWRDRWRDSTNFNTTLCYNLPLF